MRMLLRRLFMCSFGTCGGRVISGIHDGWIWIGWRCGTCGKVSDYAPTRKLPETALGIAPEDQP